MDDLDLGATIRGFSPGQKAFNRYTLKKILGRGGMGVVWLARDEDLEIDVALKFLPEMVAADRAAIEDMKREVRRAIHLAHPHIVKIHDFVTDGRTAAVSMEHISGGTLSSLRIDQPAQVFRAEDLAKWVAQLCDALDYAHVDAEVVHRDLKPANLMVDAKGRLRILDFGIAASISESVTRVSKQAGSSGTPVYMSPQQMMGEDPAVTDDIYAVGATLFELLTGKPPFHSGNILLQVQNKPAPLVNERRQAAGHAPVPVAWEQAIAGCLAKDAVERPQSGADLLRQLGGGVAPPAPKPTSAELPSPSAPPAAVAPPAPSPAELPGASVSWFRRWIVGPLLPALMVATVIASDSYNPVDNELASVVFFVSLSTFWVGGFFLLAVIRPWKRRGSYGVTIFGAMLVGALGFVSNLRVDELVFPYGLIGALLGGCLGACGGWLLNRLAARATFFPSGPIRGLTPGMVFGGQALVWLACLIFFGSVQRNEFALIREKQMEARRVEWAPKVRQTFQDVFGRAPEAGEEKKYLDLASERTWFDLDMLSRDMRESPEGKQAIREQAEQAHRAKWSPLIRESFRMVFQREPTAEEQSKYLVWASNERGASDRALRRELRQTPQGKQGGRLLVPEEFPSIQQAIYAAVPGNVVVVGPGTYRESLTLTSGIKLIGQGADRVMVEVAPTEPGLNCSDIEGAEVRGLSFRHTGTTEDDRRHALVSLRRSVVQISGCRMIDSNGDGVWIGESGSYKLSDCLIRGARWAGVSINNAVEVELTGCEVREGLLVGIAGSRITGRIVLAANRVERNGNGGIWIPEAANLQLFDNQVTGNGTRSPQSNGIGFVRGSPELRGNVSANNSGRGIWWQADTATPRIGPGNFSDGKELPRSQ